MPSNFRRAAALLLALLWLPAGTAAQQAAEIDALIGKATELSSPQVRRADLAIPYLKQALALSEHHRDRTRGALAAARLGAAYRSTHDAAAGMAVLERGAVLAREANRPDLEGLCLRTIANIHIEAGDYDLAGGYLAQTLAIADRTADAALRIATLNTLSASTRHQGRLGEALGYGRDALLLLDREVDAGRKAEPQALFAVPFNVGKALADGGDYAQALEYFERAFHAAEASGLIAGVWHALFDTGEWYQSQGDLDRAAAYYRRALEQSRKTESRDMEASTIRGLASISEARGEFPEAVEGYRAALAMYEKYSFGVWVPSTMTALARAERKGGWRERAEATLTAATERARRQSRPSDLAGLASEIGDAARGRGDLIAAERAYLRARTIARDNGLRQMEAVAASRLARVAQDQGDAERALVRYGEAEALIRGLQARIPAPDQRATFRDAVHATFTGEFELLMDLARRHPAGAYDRQAFLTLERERAQELKGDLVDGRADTAGPRPSGSLLQQTAIERRLAEIQSELMSDDISDQRRRALRAELDDREWAWDAAIASDSEHTHSGLDPAARIDTSAEKIGQALLPGEALLEYSASHVFVVTRDSIHAAEITDLAGMADRIDFFGRLLSHDDPAQAPVSGQILFSALVAPALRLVPAGTSRLVVSAAGPLAHVPFGALPDPERGTPLLVRYDITYTASAGALVAARRARTARPPALLAVANPSGLGSPAQHMTASLTRAGAFGSLPFAMDEANRVARYARSRSRVLTGPTATEYEFKHLALSDFTVLHFATHAVLDSVVPMRSAIVMGSGRGEDGLLQAREVFQMPLNADLVVLSACRTAAGRPSTAEGMQSLARAFTYAGARAVIGTLWDVDDRSSAALMERFYDGLANGLPASEALRRAQLALMGSSPYVSAPAWAAFVLTGDGATPVRLTTEPIVSTRLVVFATVGLMTVIGAALLLAWRRRRGAPQATVL